MKNAFFIHINLVLFSKLMFGDREELSVCDTLSIYKEHQTFE